MRSAIKAALSVAVILVLASTCICITPSSSSEMTFQDGKHYGVADTISYDEFDDTIFTISGKHITEWIQQFFLDHITDYSLDKIEVNLNAAITARRDVTVEDNICTLEDYLSGFMETHVILDISGKYPAEGTYYPEKGEEVLDFMSRVFSEGSGQRSTDMHSDLSVYGEVWLTTHVDVSTGLIIDADLEVKLLIEDYEHNNIQILLETDENSDPVSMDITYEEHEVENMFYTDLEFALTSQNMRVTSPNPNWRIDNAVVKEHVEKSIVSSDLADSLWLTVLAASGGEGDGNTKLPELILKILGSGGRMLDLFDTIKSLTSSDIPDVEFSMVFNAHDYFDEAGYEYSKLVPPDKTTGNDDPTRPPLYFPSGGYTLDVAQYVKYIPDSILNEEYKKAATWILIALGLGYDDNDPHILPPPITVSDLAGHDDVRMQSDMIRSYVNQKISSAEVESYSTPEIYEYIAWGGIAITVLVIVLMWRRYI